MKAPILEQADVETLFLYIKGTTEPSKWNAMLLLSLRLGLRPIEIANLDTSWIVGAELRIPHGKSKGGGQKGTGCLPLSEEVLNALNDYLGERTGRVFLTARGEEFSPQGVSDAMRRLYREAGVQGGCYAGRRTLATTLCDNGVPLPVIQQVLRHRHISTTISYCAITPSMIAKALYG